MSRWKFWYLTVAVAALAGTALALVLRVIIEGHHFTL